MFKLSIAALAIASLLSYGQASADIILTEDFSSFMDGASIDGAMISGGTGSATIDTNGMVAVNDMGGVTLTASTARTAIQIDLNSGDIEIGQFSFDITQTTPGPNTSLFTQLTEGGRSTGGTPIPGFAQNLNGNGTDFTTTQTVNYFFNTTATAFSYTAPDGVVQTIDPGTIDVFIGTNQISNNATNFPNGQSTAPTEIGTFLFQTFGTQNGTVFTFDNLFLEDLDHIVAVPEPGSCLALLGIGLVSMLRRRRS